MPAREPTWTEERVELLKIRFTAGLSCRQIADDIGVSRNAVIGNLSRLNLSREKSGDERRPARKQAGKGRRARSLPRLQYQMLRTLYAGPQTEAYDEPVESQHCCSLLELSGEGARGPIPPRGEEVFCFSATTPPT